MITATITYGDSRLDCKPALVITRGLVNHVEILLQTAGTLTFADVVKWELVVTKNYDTATQNILCAATEVTMANNILTAEINANTYELTSYIGARDTAVAVVTIRGLGGDGAIVRTYTCLVCIANVGYAGADIATTAISDIVYTRAQVDAKFDAVGNAIPAATESSRGTIALATVAETAAGVEADKAVTPATLGAVLSDAIPVIPPIPADISDLSDTTGILTGNQPTANKTQSVDAEDPSADKFPSEAAVVDYVEGAIPVIPPIPADISDLSDTTGILTGKESTANKATDFTTVDDTKFPTTQAVATYVSGITGDIPDDLSDLTDATGILAGKVDVVAGKGLSTNDYTDADVAKVCKIELETLTELTGANVTIAPWTQSKWSASGACSLTASGWAASGHQVAYIVITLAAGATPSVSGATVADDDALSAAGVYECYIKNVDGKKYFRVISFTEAAS